MRGPAKWSLVDEDEGARVYRACPFCGRRLKWRYDNDRDFTLGVPQCEIHGSLDTWAIRTAGHMLGVGRLTLPGILLPSDDDDLVVFTVEYDGHRFKAVAPKRHLRQAGGLLEHMEVDDAKH